MFLRPAFESVFEVGGGGHWLAPAPEPIADDPPDVAAILYVSGGRLVRVMIGDGLT